MDIINIFKISNLNLNCEHFQKKMTLLADVFLKLQTLKIVVNDTSTSSMINGTKHC